MNSMKLFLALLVVTLSFASAATTDLTQFGLCDKASTKCTTNSSILLPSGTTPGQIEVTVPYSYNISNLYLGDFSPMMLAFYLDNIELGSSYGRMDFSQGPLSIVVQDPNFAQVTYIVSVKRETPNTVTALKTLQLIDGSNNTIQASINLGYQGLINVSKGTIVFRIAHSHPIDLSDLRFYNASSQADFLVIALDDNGDTLHSTQALSFENDQATIQIVAQSGDKQTYTIVAQRLPISTSTGLTFFIVGDENGNTIEMYNSGSVSLIDTLQGSIVYTLAYDSDFDLSELTLLGYGSHDTSTFLQLETMEGNPLQTGSTITLSNDEFQFQVKSESGSLQTYTLTLKKALPNDQANLITLRLCDNNINCGYAIIPEAANGKATVEVALPAETDLSKIKFDEFTVSVGASVHYTPKLQSNIRQETFDFLALDSSFQFELISQDGNVTNQYTIRAVPAIMNLSLLRMCDKNGSCSDAVNSIAQASQSQAGLIEFEVPFNTIISSMKHSFNMPFDIQTSLIPNQYYDFTNPRTITLTQGSVVAEYVINMKIKPPQQYANLTYLKLCDTNNHCATGDISNGKVLFTMPEGSNLDQLTIDSISVSSYATIAYYPALANTYDLRFNGTGLTINVTAQDGVTVQSYTAKILGAEFEIDLSSTQDIAHIFSLNNFSSWPVVFHNSTQGQVIIRNLQGHILFSHALPFAQSTIEAQLESNHQIKVLSINNQSWIIAPTVQ
jgi:hypothetical protein